MRSRDYDPEKHSIVITPRGAELVFKDVPPKPVHEYYEGQQIPSAIQDALVFEGPRGAVIVPPGVERSWDREAEEQACEGAKAVETSIRENGYYRSVLTREATDLAQKTGWEFDITEQTIIEAFKIEFGMDPYEMLAEAREAETRASREQQIAEAEQQIEEMEE